jgi:hypothetical protein
MDSGDGFQAVGELLRGIRVGPAVITVTVNSI